MRKPRRSWSSSSSRSVASARPVCTMVPLRLSSFKAFARTPSDSLMIRSEFISGCVRLEGSSPVRWSGGLAVAGWFEGHILRQVRHPLIRGLDELVPFLLCPVSAVSIRSCSLSKGFWIASHAPGIDLIHMIFRPTPRIGWLGRMGSVHVKMFAVEGWGDRVSVVIVDRLRLSVRLKPLHATSAQRTIVASLATGHSPSTTRTLPFGETVGQDWGPIIRGRDDVWIQIFLYTRVELFGTSAIVEIRLSVNDGAVRQSGQIGECPLDARRDVTIAFQNRKCLRHHVSLIYSTVCLIHVCLKSPVRKSRRWQRWPWFRQLLLHLVPVVRLWSTTAVRRTIPVRINTMLDEILFKTRIICWGPSGPLGRLVGGGRGSVRILLGWHSRGCLGGFRVLQRGH